MAITLLDPMVADAIAAGEVVDRPAAVVKELLENAIDAGASRVSVEVEGAGVTRICVTDDGDGIDPGDLGLAFTRHATSKVRTLADLGEISTLGFRGEALASIAAVARVECRSTPAGATSGACIAVEFGSVGAVAAAPPVPGTRLEVRALFENTPARRAFLKRPATETAQIVRTVAAAALARPDVAVSLSIDGRRVLGLAGGGDLVAALGVCLPGIPAGSLLPIAGARGDSSLEGVLCEPGSMRRSRDQLYLAVNGRPVHSRSLAFAVEQAYRGLAHPGFFPAGVIQLRVPAQTVDVNVHPTKREVRFREERVLFGLVQEACLQALRGSGGYSGRGVFREAPDETVRREVPPTWAEQPAGRPGGAALPVTPGAAWEAYVPVEMALRDGGSLTPGPSTPALLRGPFRLVGQAMNSYIIAEGPSGLVLVDQHAAHERVVFNRLVAARESAGSDRLQPLLVPPLIHLSPVQASCLAASREELRQAGIDLEDFGGGTARVLAIDPSIPERGLDRLVSDVLDDLLADARETDLARRLERATYTLACHSSIRFGQALSRQEMEALLRDLEVADPGITCPHGRPTYIEIDEGRLRREFRRS